ncbi:Cell polarity protein [Yarrowia sp. B02]|nr:Cell polarity protein [Yarrowia sp. B02]
MPDISLFITSDATSGERRLDPSLSLVQITQKLESVTGISPSYQKLTLYGGSQPTVIYDPRAPDASVAGSKTLESFNPQHLARLHVSDTSGKTSVAELVGGGQEDLDSRYQMPQTEYETKSDTVLDWKRKNQLGRFDPNAKERLDKSVEEAQEAIESRGIKLGLRCEINGSKRGVVRYIGEIPEITDSGAPWIGVELDEPLGKNDGTVKGKRYFQCKDKFGSFVKPQAVEVGDFPEEFDDEI